MKTAFREVGIEGVAVASAGVRALVGDPMDRTTAEVAESVGVNCSGHVARPVTREALVRARVVLTATRAQRSEVVAIYPPCVQYTFTIRQLGRLLSVAQPTETSPRPSGGDLLDALRHLATRQRGQHLIGGAEDDVLDPHGHPVEVHRLAIEQMLPALQQVADRLKDLHDAEAPKSI